MKTRVIMLFSLCLLFAGKANAQWVVTDPTNLAQGIINATKNIIHTSSTATNMINNFKETVKIYEQGKKYYDALKSVNNLIKDARKVQQMYSAQWRNGTGCQVYRQSSECVEQLVREATCLPGARAGSPPGTSGHCSIFLLGPAASTGNLALTQNHNGARQHFYRWKKKRSVEFPLHFQRSMAWQVFILVLI